MLKAKSISIHPFHPSISCVWDELQGSKGLLEASTSTSGSTLGFHLRIKNGALCYCTTAQISVFYPAKSLECPNSHGATHRHKYWHTHIPAHVDLYTSIPPHTHTHQHVLYVHLHTICYERSLCTFCVLLCSHWLWPHVWINQPKLRIDLFPDWFQLPRTLSLKKKSSFQCLSKCRTDMKMDGRSNALSLNWHIL